MQRLQNILALNILSLVVVGGGLAQELKVPIEHIVFQANDTQRCLKCHSMANFAFRDSATTTVHSFSVNPDTFKASVHGTLACQQCHSDIKGYPHVFSAARQKVSCASDCHATDSTGKAYSHQAVYTEFQTSVHRKGLTRENPDSPTCTTCHGTGRVHAIEKVKKTITIQEKMALCVSCHDDEAKMVRNKVNPKAVSSYQHSFHFKAIKFGETNTAVCQDCHTVHHILPKDSVQSSISQANISQTCGQEKCHSGAQMNFSMSGANHLALRVEHEPILNFMENFFFILTLGTMMMLLVGIVLDVQKKFGWFSLAGKLVTSFARSFALLKSPAMKLFRFSKKLLID